MSVSIESFGRTGADQEVECLTIMNAGGLSCAILTFGARLNAMRAPDRDGAIDDVVLGFDTMAECESDLEFMGPTVGRFANRIGGAAFTLDGVRYELPANEPPNHLHGGPEGFHRKVWTIQHSDEQSVTLNCLSPDGEAGYPGNVSASAIFALTDDNELKFSYEATTDAPTPVNLTNHAYWNLAGAGSGDVLGHEVQIDADHVLEVDDGLVPTGELVPVADGPLDFRTPHTVGQRLADAPLAARWQRGYDHCFVLRPREALAPAASAFDPAGGRLMEISSTQAATMFYTGNDLSGTAGAGGRVFDRYGGLCLELQNHPDAPNKPAFPSSILEPGQVYRHQTVHRFGVR